MTASAQHDPAPDRPRRRLSAAAALAATLGGPTLWLAAGCGGPVARPEAEPEFDDPAARLDREGFALSADFDPFDALWLSYHEGHAELTAGLVRALQGQVALRFLVNDAAGEAATREFLRRRDLRPPRLAFLHEPLASFFVRDLAVFLRGPRGPGLVDFRWSEYGVPAWCVRRHPDALVAARCAADADYSREGVDSAIARRLGWPLFRSSVAIEGGGVEVNGRGLMIANEALLLNRNPGRSRNELQAALLRLPGLRKIIWLPGGLAEDPPLRATITGDYVAWGAGGHTDEFVRFADPRTVLLAWPEDADVASHPVARLTRQRMQRNAEILAAAGDAQGGSLRVLRLPMPRPMQRRVVLAADSDPARPHTWTADSFPPQEGRRAGQVLRQMATASYLNHVVANGAVVAPDYLPHGTPAALQERVRRVLEQAYPGREIHFVDAASANWVGGGLHCATLNQP